VIILEPVQKLIFPNVGAKLKDKTTGEVSFVDWVDPYDGAVKNDGAWYYVEFGAVIYGHMGHPRKKMCSSINVLCDDMKNCMFAIFIPNGEYCIGEII
jgi:hypothetical protein